MKISLGLNRDYPKLAKWILENIPKVKDKPTVWAAFKLYAELSQNQALRSIQNGLPPEIDFRVMPGANGEFSGSSHPDTVFLAKAICDKFEGSESDAKDARMHLLLESTILHEMVHWGDWKDGVDQPGEEGKQFEIAAYGKDIDRYW